MPESPALHPCRSRGDWRTFEALPELLHGDDPSFVPPVPGDVARLGTAGGPFARHGTLTAWIARDPTGRPVGRIAAIVNRTHDAFHGDRVGFFGFFDFADADVAAALFAAARRDLAARGCRVLRGPVNPTQNEACGVHVAGFGRRPSFGMPWNPPWYADVYQSLGMVGVRDMYAYRLGPELEAAFDARLGRIAERLRERVPVTVRALDPRRLEAEAHLVSRLFNTSLADEWNFMPLTPEAALDTARELSRHLDPEAILIAEVRGEPAGLSIMLPDLNELLVHLRGWPRILRLPRLALSMLLGRPSRARWAVFGMLPEYRKRGATLLLIHEAVTWGRRRYGSGELAWTQDINPEVNRLAGQLGLTPDRTYRMYEASPAPPLPGESAGPRPE